MSKGIVTIKVISDDESLITDCVRNRIMKVYPPESSIDVSKLQKRVGETTFHVFVKIVVDKALLNAPKEQTDVKVREVQ